MSSVLYGSGTIVGKVGSAQGITARKQAEWQLLQLTVGR